jgi:hypothetical protein
MAKAQQEIVATARLSDAQIERLKNYQLGGSRLEWLGDQLRARAGLLLGSAVGP